MDKKFFDAHPPLITSADEDMPERSDFGVVGVFEIKGAEMNRVIDPQYPWRDYTSGNSPAYRKKILEILAQRDAEVSHYVVTRQRYWNRQGRWHYGTDEEVTITKHSGYVEHHSHIADQSHTVVERIAADLGINLSAGGADLPVEVPPVVPAVTMAADEGQGGGGSGGGSGGNIGLHFSQEMTDTLHITDTDEQTYTTDTTVTTDQTFKGGTTYVYWQMLEECILERVLKATPDKPGLIYKTLGAMSWDYTDAYPRPSNGSGDIH